MENEQKILLTSLYNNINSYSDIIEVFDNLSKGFEDYFGDDITDGISESEGKFIIDYNTYHIIEHREIVLNMFYQLSKGIFRVEQCIGLDKNEILPVLDSVESILEKKVALFKIEAKLEIRSFVNKKCGNSNSLVKELNDFFKQSIENNIPYIIHSVSEIKDEVEKLLIEELNTYDMNLWNMKKCIGKLWKDRSEVEEGMFIEEMFLEREEVIDKIDCLKSRIESVIKENFLNPSIEIIRENLSAKILEKTRAFKCTLNGFRARRIMMEQQEKLIEVGYENIIGRSIDAELYDMCSELFLIQYEYLKTIINLSKVGFDAINDEIKFAMDSIFINEFYGPIYYINTDEDFKRICISLEEKVHYLLYNFVIEAIKNFKTKYYDYITNTLLRKKSRLNNMYMFKSIDNYKGYINSYNHEVTSEVYKKIHELYKSYTDKKEIYNFLNNELNTYSIDSHMQKDFLEEYMGYRSEYENLFNIDNYSNVEYLEDKKHKLHENIKTFKTKICERLEEDFISYFDYMFQTTGRNIEYVKRQAKYYKEKDNLKINL
ncbi:hypothetical protein [Clostridium sp.]|uniref:hypothetical protein n=1 Tax=Clostridium sp. TaxID=1506 RepID=UPI00321712B6